MLNTMLTYSISTPPTSCVYRNKTRGASQVLPYEVLVFNVLVIRNYKINTFFFDKKKNIRKWKGIQKKPERGEEQ